MQSSISLYRLILIVCLYFLGSNALLGQKVLQVEKRNKVKTIKFYTGDHFFIKVYGEKYWREVTLIDMDIDKAMLEFETGTWSVDEIKALKTPGQKNAGRNVRNYLLQSALGFAVYGIVDIIFQDKPNWTLIGVGLGIAPLGFLLEPIINTMAIHRFNNKRKRLRALDLSL